MTENLEPDELRLLELLKQINEGDKPFFLSSNDSGETAINEFQETVMYVDELEKRGYIANVKKLTGSSGRALEIGIWQGLTFSGKQVLKNPERIKNMNNETKQPSFNIGTVNAHAVQVGTENVQTINITVQQLIEQIAKSNDAEAKSLLKQLFENSTVANIIGAGAATLFGL